MTAPARAPEPATVRRCTGCGSWRVGLRPCTACHRPPTREARTVHIHLACADDTVDLDHVRTRLIGCGFEVTTTRESPTDPRLAATADVLIYLGAEAPTALVEFATGLALGRQCILIGEPTTAFQAMPGVERYDEWWEPIGPLLGQLYANDGLAPVHVLHAAR